MKLSMPGSLLLVATLLMAGICWAQGSDAPKDATKETAKDAGKDVAKDAGKEAPAFARTYLDFDANWLFSRGEFANAMTPAFDDSYWRRVNLPHDWSVEGPFSPEGGSGNGYAPGGIGFYRKYFQLDPAYKGKIVAIEFDGVYNNAEVWINGQYIGGRPYGYISFECDLTPYLKFGPDENILTVRVDHSRFADSRWYTGSGIYRHVRLCVTDKFHIGHWGTFVTTPQVKADWALVNIETTIDNASGEKKPYSLELQIVAPDGQIVASRGASGTADVAGHLHVVQAATVERPQLWSLESPALYKLISRLKVDGKPVDETSTTFGIRTIRFDPDKGFFLNDKPLKIKGVCLHHDAGSLGAAVPEKVLERRLRLLKDLGVNTIRTSHNPPAPELLDLCDRMGLLVKDEAFDEFTPTKNKWVAGWNNGVPGRYGYGEVFDQWAVTDIQDMVLRDRNHPSIIMWSIGNEVDYANDPFSHDVLDKEEKLEKSPQEDKENKAKTPAKKDDKPETPPKKEYRPENPQAEDMVKCAKPLIEAVKNLDPSRPVTAALANVKMSGAVGLGELLDVVGYNYQEDRYFNDHKKYPKRFIFGSENNHTYKAWTAVRDNDYICGQFLWTGIDYLGEAKKWPNRGAAFGLLDLCGYKKPLGWFRQSLWTDKPMVYICSATRATEASEAIEVAPATEENKKPRRMILDEHWNWPKDKKIVTVYCATNCPEVLLTLNDKLIGTKRLAEATNGFLSWEVTYEPGVLKALGQNNGITLCEYVLKTADKASRIEISPDVTELCADGKDVCHLEFRIVDAQGVRVPDAANKLTFDVEGPAAVIGIDNGDLDDSENPKDPAHKAYRGRGLAIIQSKKETGKITIKVSSPGLDTVSLTLTSR